MAYVDWQEWMATGVPLVDDDHRVLISLLNQVHDCLGAPEERANLGSVLAALSEYTDYHFQREERLQKAVGFPGLAEHRKMHVRLTDQVREIHRRYRADPESVRAVDVQTFLQHWLIEHILNQDMEFRSYAQDRPEAEAVARASITDVFGGNRAVAWQEISVLVVDDNSNFLTLMATILHAIGAAKVHTAQSAVEGLEILYRRAVDVVVTDRFMSEMDGFEFIAQIRASSDPVVSQVAVVMVSGRGDDESRERAFRVGADDFLEKPLSASELLRKMAKFVEMKRQLTV